MNALLEDHKAFIYQLIKNNVDFMLVGGMAVIYHGYPRTTGDVDIWLKPDNENKKKIIQILKEDKVFEDDIEYLNSLDFSTHLVFHIGEKPNKIDFLTKISGVSYQEADAMKNYFELDGYQVPILHVNHLIISKLSSDRIKDKADAEELQKIQNLKKGKA